jgi:DNA repair exonuclease SbcCD nuclease subunit
MLILTIGDIHCKINNFTILDKLLIQILNLLNEKKYDFIVLLGDLLHNHEKINTLELNFILNFIKQLSLKIKVFILVGNHDMINNQEYLSSNNWMTLFQLFPHDNIEIINKPLEFGEYLFMPYVYSGRFIETLNESNIDWKNKKIIFAHQEISGCKYGGIVSTKEKWDEKYPMLICGHIHDKQYIQKNLIYPGIPFTHNFGDSMDNTLLEIKDDISFLEIKTNLPYKKNIFYNINDIIIHDDINLYSGDINQYKFVIRGNENEIKYFREKYKHYFNIQNIKITFKNESNNIVKKLDNNFNKSFIEILNQKMMKQEKYIQELYNKL